MRTSHLAAVSWPTFVTRPSFVCFGSGVATLSRYGCARSDCSICGDTSLRNEFLTKEVKYDSMARLVLHAKIEVE